MHDPLVVAFEIRRPWPKRSQFGRRRRWYWPPIITVWHREPGGADSGTVCPHMTRWTGPDGKWRAKVDNRWRWHVHHWKVQVHPAQEAQRWLFQRCAWCGGPSRRGNLVNVSHAWSDGRSARWWESEPHLYHVGCSSAEEVVRTCTCDQPVKFGHLPIECARCGKTYRDDASWVARRRAISIAGYPKRGRAWRWPREVVYEDIKRELEAEASQ